MKDIRITLVVVLTLIVKLLEIIIWILVQTMKKRALGSTIAVSDTRRLRSLAISL